MREDALPDLRKLDEPSLLAQVLYRMGEICISRFDPAEGKRYHREAAEFAIRAGDQQAVRLLELLGHPDPSGGGE
jgi:hypothetical protein